MSRSKMIWIGAIIGGVLMGGVTFAHNASPPPPMGGAEYQAIATLINSALMCMIGAGPGAFVATIIFDRKANKLSKEDEKE